jgi:hypothetical protein
MAPEGVTRLSHGERMVSARKVKRWSERIDARMPLPCQSTYRVPPVLRDLVLVDMLELTGSTVATASLLQMSQPSVSRRYRALAEDLGLERQKHLPIGRRYGDTDWLLLLRRGVNAHRHTCGVVRVGGPAVFAAAAMDGRSWVEWVSLGRSALKNWSQLLQLELLDAIALPQAQIPCGQEAAGFRMVTISRDGAQPLMLVSRCEPQVLAIINRIANTEET